MIYRGRLTVVHQQEFTFVSAHQRFQTDTVITQVKDDNQIIEWSEYDMQAPDVLENVAPPTQWPQNRECWIGE